MIVEDGKAAPGGRRRPGAGGPPAILAIGLLWLCSCSDGPGEGPAADATTAVAEGESGYFVDADYLDKFCVASGVDYPVRTDERTIDGADPGPTDATLVRLYRAALGEALGAYSRAFFGEIGLRRIVLGRGLAVDGIACRAFSDVERGTLYLAIDSGPPDGSLKRTLHHEVFHFVDFAEDGRLDEDRTWSALNPPTFLYGSGGGSMQGDPDAGRPDEALVGFVNRYSTSGLAEDKAEVYAHLVADGPWMIRRASADPVLGRKAERVRTALRRFGPLAPGLLPGTR